MNQKTVIAETPVRPKVGVGVMLLKEGKVLLGKRRGAHGAATYGWCGGHVEFGEALEHAAHREVKEETGIEIGAVTFMCVSNIIQYGKHYLDVEFLCTDFEGDPTVLEHDRVESWAWYDLNDLPSPLFVAVELAIKSYRNGPVYHGVG
nr:NUDIX domain-containing protein [Micromonospora sp. DSM 115978]